MERCDLSSGTKDPVGQSESVRLKMASSGEHPSALHFRRSDVRWWDLRTLSETASLDLKDPITSMELAHGGGTLSVTAGNKVHFLDILRQHPPVTIPLPAPPTSASLHPFLRDRFVTGSTNDPWVRVYDLDSGVEKEVYKGHHGPVLCASYSPDGEVYASGSEDGTIRLWQTNPGKSYGLWQTQE